MELVKHRILVVEDEHEISEVISLYLQREGYDVQIADNGVFAVEFARKEQPDAIILDIELPGKDGVEVCRDLRQLTHAPILFLTCRGEEADKIKGFEAGGDDYIVKPFSPREMVARVQAQLRRYLLLNNTGVSPQIFSFPGLEIDVQQNTVTVDGVVIPLSSKEVRLLVLLAQGKGKTFSLEELFTEVWKSPSLGDPRTVIVHISNLRRKIERDPSDPFYILTVRGIGYKFNESLYV
jgi:DNA-binding response OmpR family regulator